MTVNLRIVSQPRKPLLAQTKKKPPQSISVGAVSAGTYWCAGGRYWAGLGCAFCAVQPLQVQANIQRANHLRWRERICAAWYRYQGKGRWSWIMLPKLNILAMSFVQHNKKSTWKSTWNQFYNVFYNKIRYIKGGSGGAVRQMRTRISLLAQPESMRSIIGATQ